MRHSAKFLIPGKTELGLIDISCRYTNVYIQSPFAGVGNLSVGLGLFERWDESSLQIGISRPRHIMVLRRTFFSMASHRSPPDAAPSSFEPSNLTMMGVGDETDPRTVGSHEGASGGDENGSEYVASASGGSTSRFADDRDDPDQHSKANLADRVAFEESQALRRLKQFGYRVVILVAVGLGLAAFFVTQAEQTSAFQASVRSLNLSLEDTCTHYSRALSYLCFFSFVCSM